MSPERSAGPNEPDEPLERRSTEATHRAPPGADSPSIDALGIGRETEELELVAAARIHAGPLPTPEMLREYDAVLPGSARRMVEMWEEQTRHRQRLERRMVDSNITSRSRGQWMAFVVALTAIIGGIALVATGHDTEGLATILLPLASLVGVFVYGQVTSRGNNDGTNGEAGE